MVVFVASLLLPWFAAYLLVGCCLRDDRGGGAMFFLRVFLAVGIGLGLSSCTYFLWLMFCGGPANGYRPLELLCFATACLLGFAAGGIRRRATNIPSLAWAPRPQGESNRLLAYVFGAALLVALLGVAGHHLAEPLGEWDAWAFWNQRARFLFRSGDAWEQAFQPAYVHSDYPLLIPASNARCWTYLGRDPGWVPWFVGSLFTFATVGVLVCGVNLLGSRSQGLLAGLVLLGTVAFLRWGAAQYADVPLAFFFLATVLLLALHDAGSQPRRGLLLLAGLTAGLAAWTKNEGLLFVIVIVFLRSLVAWRRGRGKRLAADLAACGAGLLPILGVVALLKTCLVPAVHDNQLINQTWQSVLPRILDPSRYLTIAEGFAVSVFRVAKPFAVVLPVSYLLLGKPKDRSPASVGLPAAAGVFCLMLAGYLCIYLITPYDLSWHLRTSLDRLLTQVWPVGILIFFLSRATPEEILGEAPQPAVLSEITPEPLPALSGTDLGEPKPRIAA